MERGKFDKKKYVDMFEKFDEARIREISSEIITETDLLIFQNKLNLYLAIMLSKLLEEYPDAMYEYITQNIILDETDSQMRSRKTIAQFWLNIINNALKLIRLFKSKEIEIKTISFVDFEKFRRSLYRFKTKCMFELRGKALPKNEA